MWSSAIRKRKWCKSANNCFDKLVKSHQVNWFLAYFTHLKPQCAKRSVTARLWCLSSLKRGAVFWARILTRVQISSKVISRWDTVVQTGVLKDFLSKDILFWLPIFNLPFCWHFDSSVLKGYTYIEYLVVRFISRKLCYIETESTSDNCWNRLSQKCTVFFVEDTRVLVELIVPT